MAFNLSKKCFKSKRVIESHCSFVKGLFLNAEIEEVQVLDDTERDSGDWVHWKELKCICQEQKMVKCTFFLKRVRLKKKKEKYMQ